VCRLFCRVWEINKIAKLEGLNIDTIPTLIDISCIGIVGFEFVKMLKMEGAKIFCM